jgi:hypothetical protein
MEKQASPHIDSFVIRFVLLETEAEGSTPRLSPAYRGSITHVQTDEELTFNRWEDAVSFIQRFVPAILQVESKLTSEDRPVQSGI